MDLTKQDILKMTRKFGVMKTVKNAFRVMG